MNSLTRTHTCTHARTHARTQARTQAHMHVRTHARIHKQIHTRTRIYTRTCVHACVCACVFVCVCESVRVCFVWSDLTKRKYAQCRGNILVFPLRQQVKVHQTKSFWTVYLSVHNFLYTMILRSKYFAGSVEIWIFSVQTIVNKCKWICSWLILSGELKVVYCFEHSNARSVYALSYQVDHISLKDVKLVPLANCFSLQPCIIQVKCLHFSHP